MLRDAATVPVSRVLRSSRPCGLGLQVCYGGYWGTVCDDGFTDASAAVVCRWAIHGAAVWFVRTSPDANVHMDRGGLPLSIAATAQNALASTAATTGDLRCVLSHSSPCESQPAPSTQQDTFNHTVWPTSPHILYGRRFPLDYSSTSTLAHYHYAGPLHPPNPPGSWAAQVPLVPNNPTALPMLPLHLRRQLGYGGGVAVPSEWDQDRGPARFPPGSWGQPVQLGGVQCNGKERRLADCPADPWRHAHCTLANAVGESGAGGKGRQGKGDVGGGFGREEGERGR